MEKKRFRLRVSIAATVIMLAATAAAIDTLGYFFLPQRYTRAFPGYRQDDSPPLNKGRPHYRSDPERGFDIAENDRGYFTVDGTTFPVFSNSLGCFDKNEVSAFRAGNYVYFAGDSYTWGYAPYQDKFVTRFEAATGITSAKCGVIHSGTRHEFSKFLSVTSRIGRLPAVVFLVFTDNDIQNDYAYPHTTAIDGYAVDTAYVEEPRTLKLVRPPRDQIVKEFERYMSSAGTTAPSPLKEFLKRYSLTANLLKFAIVEVRAFVRGRPEVNAGSKSKFGYSIYYLAENHAIEVWNNPTFNYRDTPLVRPNRAALRIWKAHALENHYRLVVVIMPPLLFFADTRRYTEFKHFLDEIGIDRIDLTIAYAHAKFSEDDLYWPINDHPSPKGNIVTGKILASRVSVAPDGQIQVRVDPR